MYIFCVNERLFYEKRKKITSPNQCNSDDAR